MLRTALLASALLLAPLAAHAVVGVPQPRQLPRDLIVTYADTRALDEAADNILPGLDRFHRLDRIPGERAVLQFRTPSALAAALAELRADPDVVSVEVAEIITADYVPNDPLYPSQWGPRLIGLEEASDVETGDSTVLVVVVDSVATCTTHPDLAPNCRQDLARDFISTETAVCQHGWHVSGTAAAVINNGIGIAGIAGSASIVPLRFLNGSCSGSSANVLLAWDYALSLADQGYSVVVNNSFGGGSYSQVHQDTLEAMRAAGIVVVASAGNGGNDQVGDDICAIPVYPASYAGVFAVASIDIDQGLSSYSNYGNCANGAEVGAPGRDILSTCSGSTYCQLSGTSMSSPHVVGQAALILSTDPELSVAQVEQRIIDTAAPLPELANKTVAGGRIHLPELLGEPEPGIRLSLTCDSAATPQEETLDCAIGASGRGGYAGQVQLDCGGVPAAACVIEDDSIATGDSTGMTLTPSIGTPVGVHTLVVDGTSGGHEASAQTSIEVWAAGTVTVGYTQSSSIILIPGGVATSTLNVPVGYNVIEGKLIYRVACFPKTSCSATLVSPDGIRLPLAVSIPTSTVNLTVLYPSQLDGFRPAGAWKIEARAPAKRFGPPNPQFRIWPWTLTLTGVPAN